MDIESELPLLETHVPFAFDRQLLLADLIGDLDWAYDLQTGLLSFGDQISFEADVIGTESDETSTWLWAWANKESNIPSEQQSASLKLKALGTEHGIAELTEPIIPLEHADGHAFATIAVGEGFGQAYYRGPYEGGAVFLLITDEKLYWQVEEPLQRILTVFPQIISNLEIANHQTALKGYLMPYGFDVEEEERCLRVREKDKEVLYANFDELDRLLELRGTIDKKVQT